MRVAAVDLGTNSTRLLVADVSDGDVDELVRRSVITRLGEGVDARRRLLPVPVARVRNVLAGFRREAAGLGAERVLAVATSAVRDAENGEAFLGEVEWSYGFATRLLSGEEEADLTLRGVGSGRPLRDGTIVLDVGGGSTELVGEGIRVSLDVGSVRLTERFLHGDPPTPGELQACAAAVRAELPQARCEHLVGVAGTVTSLAAVELGGYDAERVDGHRLTRAAVDAQVELLSSLPLAERREVAGLEPERAPVIVGGAIVVRETLRHFGLEALEVSERDLLTGAALAAAELPEPVDGAAPPGAYTVLLRLAALSCAALLLGGCGGNGGKATSSAGTTAASGLPAGCDPAAVKGAIERFLAAITAGDRRRIARSLSPEPDFERLTIADPDGVFRTDSRAKAADYLAARHGHGENERLLQAVADAGADAGHALVRFTIVRTASDFPARNIHTRAAIGEASINCLTQRISRWRLATGRA